MAATMMVEIPKSIRNRMEILAHENFCLWMFISNQDLWDEARDYIDEASQRPHAFECWMDTGLVYTDPQNNPPFGDDF